MDLRQIGYFVVLYEEGKVTHAARKLNIVQPALSMQIRRLEQELGVALFERTPRGVVATPAGQVMYELYLPILRELRHANQRMMELSGKVLGKIAVGVIPSITNSVLADVLRRFRAQFPDVEVKIDEAYSGILIDWVSTGDLDFAIVNRTRPRSGISSHLLVKEELMLVGRRQRDGNEATPIPFADLAGLRLVLPSRRHGLRMIVEQIAEAEGFAIVPRIEVDALGPTLRLVATSDLMTVLPEVAVREAIAELPLTARRITGPRLTRELVCVHRAQRPLSLASAKFVELATEELTRGVERVRG